MFLLIEILPGLLPSRAWLRHVECKQRDYRLQNMTSAGEKRPPSSPLESTLKERKMNPQDDKEPGEGGINAVDNSAIMTGIRNNLPGLMSEIMDANMAAMEKRLTATISNMTKRLEDKIDSSNVSFNERIDNIETVQEGFANRLQDFDDRIGNVESTTETNSGLHDMLVTLAKRVASLEDQRIKDEENQYLRSRVDELERLCYDTAMELRDKRICISGIKEVNNESPKKAAVRTLNQLASKYANPTPSQASKHQSIIKEDDIDIAYRSGKRIGKNPQNIVIHLKWSQTKLRIMALKKKMLGEKQVKHFISDDIPFEVRGLRQKLKNISEAAKNLDMESRVIGNKLSLNGKTYTSAELDGLSDEILEGTAQIKEVNGGVAYRGDSAFLSNFYPAPFSLDNHEFANVEQFFQYKKCLMMGEINMAAKILRTSRPLQAKTLGDKFKDSEEWMEERAKCMLNGTMAKYTQNVDLARKLLKTGDNGLYEATTDSFFGAGIGLGSNLWATGKWKGNNAAGKICMNVRSFLKEEIDKGTELDTIANKISYPVSPSIIPRAISTSYDEHESSSSSGSSTSSEEESDVEDSEREPIAETGTSLDSEVSMECTPSQVIEQSQVRTSESDQKQNPDKSKIYNSKRSKPGKGKQGKGGNKARRNKAKATQS